MRNFDVDFKHMNQEMLLGLTNLVAHREASLAMQLKLYDELAHVYLNLGINVAKMQARRAFQDGLAR